MTYNRQIAYPIAPREYLERTDTGKLLAHNRRVKRFKVQQALEHRILKIIAISSLLSTGLFGIGALGCWEQEIIEANTKSIILSKQHDWQMRKHICLGWMLFTFSSFLGSASLSKKSATTARNSRDFEVIRQDKAVNIR
ncbi:hypothetical protein QUB80_15050 [Chlorogloeopsis sp. ULAP01]|uniref:hypothetical protein n=1 Tax=Chlorogloeopsis sp. ULAP01 TaxID=3056483 RepID=UPI0025AA3680|nr:hypothetical protein [Chlorogloeopsis sp. ULAP01]MDM9382019.1 hypothetical protein [Chlorogloeopsis sp. ULAP01]